MIALLLSLAAFAVDVAPDQGLPDAAVAAAPHRAAPPDVPRPDRLALPEPEVHALGPVEVRLVPVDGVRRVEVYVHVDRGYYELAGWPTEPVQVMGALMDVATERHAADALSELKDLHEIELWSWMSHHDGAVSLSVPREDLELGLDLLAEVLKTPAYPKKDVARYLRDRRLYFERTGPTSPAYVARAALAYAWFPADHPYGARPDLEAMRKVRPRELEDLHASWLADGPVTVVVAGDVAWSEVEPLLAEALSGVGGETEPAAELPVDLPAETRIVAVDMPGQQQTTLALRLAAPARDHADRPAFEVLQYALGGHFLSRLNANLREDKGYTYGARATYQDDETHGSLTITVDVAAANTGAAIGEIAHELGRLVDGGVTAEEIDWAVRAGLFDWNETRATAASTRAFYVERLQHGETVAEAAARGDRALGIDPDDVREVAVRWLADDQPRVWVVVGDRAQVAPQLEALGWDVRWGTPAAAMVGDLSP